jgi:hypothetical protein
LFDNRDWRDCKSPASEDVNRTRGIWYCLIWNWNRSIWIGTRLERIKREGHGVKPLYFFFWKNELNACPHKYKIFHENKKISYGSFGLIVAPRSE